MEELRSVFYVAVGIVGLMSVTILILRLWLGKHNNNDNDNS
jgi:hypothetical protein